MKYDCNKTLDFTHEKRRMCDSFKNCTYGCPLIGNCHGTKYTTSDEIATVQKWSDGHPEKTRKEAFFELFPKCVHSTTTICFYMLIGENKCCGKKLTSCDECWNEPYEGEFEKAREEENGKENT